jgi:hypothetical protein
MKDQFLDVEIAIPQGELMDDLHSTAKKDALSAALVEKARVKAEEEVRLVGGRLRTDRAPEFYIRRGSHIIDGGDFMLVASRWACVVPNSFDPTHAR